MIQKWFAKAMLVVGRAAKNKGMTETVARNSWKTTWCWYADAGTG
ncbi:hypothetical protein ACNKHN_13515 [Shigella flexneri]